MDLGMAQQLVDASILRCKINTAHIASATLMPEQHFALSLKRVFPNQMSCPGKTH
jgi:hypothetical protein